MIILRSPQYIIPLRFLCGSVLDSIALPFPFVHFNTQSDFTFFLTQSVLSTNHSEPFSLMNPS